MLNLNASFLSVYVLPNSRSVSILWKISRTLEFGVRVLGRLVLLCRHLYTRSFRFLWTYWNWVLEFSIPGWRRGCFSDQATSTAWGRFGCSRVKARRYSTTTHRSWEAGRWEWTVSKSKKKKDWVVIQDYTNYQIIALYCKLSWFRELYCNLDLSSSYAKHFLLMHFKRWSVVLFVVPSLVYNAKSMSSKCSRFRLLNRKFFNFFENL